MMQATSVNSSRAVVNLNGDWERQVHDKQVGTVPCPSSLRPSGLYSLRREFLLPRIATHERAILRFNAVNYHGTVSLNGKQLGTTIPYVPQEFDCTQQAQEGRNLVEVQIVDAGTGPNGLGKDEVVFGTPGGWESSGGIIRDAYAEIRPRSYVENVRFGYRLLDSYGKAACTAQIFVWSSESGDGDCELVLSWGRSEVARAKARVQLKAGAKSTAELAFDLNDVALWSPAEPNLYELKVTLKGPATEDHWSCRTGFREIRIQGRNFLLNGERLVLKGTCRHDMWAGQGFTLSPRQQEKDMQMIKAHGANFVRLVHYPHDRRIIDLAEELGLLVSEEPGFWQVDFTKVERPFIDLGLRVLETTIRRDWNSPAVMAWLLGNESVFTASYLNEGKQLCNTLDPIFRPVSVAHINGPIPKATKLFDEAGLDFYDYHAYEFSEDKFIKIPQEFGPAKPLTFTEWGWEDGGHGDLFHERDFDDLLEQTEAGNVAGHTFWSWNDMRQYTREDWATHDGILLSGAVTEDRNTREPIYSRLAALFAGRREIPQYTAPAAPRLLPLRWLPFSPGSTHAIVELQALADSRSGKESWAALESSLKQFWASSKMGKEQWTRTGSRFRLWQAPVVEIAGVSFRSAIVEDDIRPLILTAEVPEITIPIDRQCSKLHILGQVTLPNGYPLRGRAGETAAIYSIVGANGGSQDIPVRNGIEVAQANRIFEATRIDPVATGAQPALEFVKDIVREQYQFLLWSVSVTPGRIRSLRCKLNSGQPALAILAITTEV
jgi:hypothetical protein